MRLLARLAYILGDPGEALAHQTKAAQMSERCLGVDHPQTVLEYVGFFDDVFLSKGPIQIIGILGLYDLISVSSSSWAFV